MYIHLDFITPKGLKITPNEPAKTEKSAKEDKRVERKQNTDIPLNFHVLWHHQRNRIVMYEVTSNKSLVVSRGHLIIH